MEHRSIRCEKRNIASKWNIESVPKEWLGERRDLSLCHESMVLLLPLKQEKTMIRKSKLVATLGAIAFIGAVGLASPTFAAGPQNYNPAYTGGGSAGYNHHVATDYRLKHHPKHHLPNTMR